MSCGDGFVRAPDLIIDVGMHDGTDTAFYLAKGFKVVAVEANPVLVEAARTRFAPEIAAGRLTIVGAAIAEQKGTMSLAVSDDPDHAIWSTLDPSSSSATARRSSTASSRSTRSPSTRCSASTACRTT